MRLLFGLLGALAAPAGVQAEVIAQAAAGFELRIATEVAAPPDRVWAALVQPGRWWSPEHTYSARSENLTLKAEARGCFCERLAEGGSVLHATVVQARPGRLLRLSGGLGPLQAQAVAASWTFELKPTPGGTSLTQTMTAGGWSSRGLDALARPVDGVLTEQQGRLKRYVETGRP